MLKGNVAINDLLHGHRDGILAGHSDGDIVDILNSENAAVLLAKHAVDIASALGSYGSEQEAVVIGLIEQVVDSGLID